MEKQGTEILSPQRPIRFKPNPFSVATEIHQYIEGESLADILSGLGAGNKLTVSIDDQVVLPGMYNVVRPKPGHMITVISHAEGGDSGTMRSVAFLAVAIAAMVAAPYLAPLIGLGSSATAITITQAVIFAVGTLAVNAMIPVAEQDQIKQKSDSTSISATRNRLDPFGVMPYVLGGPIRVIPPFAAEPYSEIAGDDQYARTLYCVSHKDCLVENPKLGSTSIHDFHDVEYQVISGGGSDGEVTDITAYADDKDIKEIIVNAVIGGWDAATADSALGTVDPDLGVSYTTTEAVDAVSIDLAALEGLLRVKDQGNADKRIVDVTVEYSTSPSGPWTFYSTTRFKGKSAKVFRKNVFINFATNAVYSFRVYRLDKDKDPDDDSPTLLDNITWTVIREINYRNAVNHPDAALAALRIRATDQLNGTPDRFNVEVTSILPVWDGSTWNTASPTNNPAALYRDILMGKGNACAVAESRVDNDSVSLFYDWCVLKGWQCNVVVDYTTTVFELMRLVLATARARPVQIDGKWGVIWDDYNNTIIQYFTPRNSWGFQGSKAYPQVPDAFRINFQNEKLNWEWDEYIVYRPGKTAATAVIYESLKLPGITDPDLIYLIGRYNLLQVIYRPETFTWHVDAEQLMVQVGSRVEYLHDAIQVGQVAARIKSIDGQNITLDAEVQQDGVTQYAVIIRRNDGTAVTSTTVIPVVSGLALADSDTIIADSDVVTGDGYQPGVTTEFTEGSAVVTLNDTVTGINAGDLVMFGESGRVTIPCLVQAIEPGPDLSARITCVQYSEQVYSEVGTPPPYDSYVSIPPGSAFPVIISIRSDESVLIRDLDGTLRPVAVITLGFRDNREDVAAVEIQYRIYDTNANFTSAGLYPGDITEITIRDVVQGELYEFRARYLFHEIGDYSPWIYYEDEDGNPWHLIIGKGEPPPSPDVLVVSTQPDGTRVFFWVQSILPPDIAGWEIRYKTIADCDDPAPDWDDMSPLHSGLLISTPFETNQISAGTYWFSIKAIDTSTNYSTNSADVCWILGDPRMGTVAYQEWLNADDWPGIGISADPDSNPPPAGTTYDCYEDPFTTFLLPAEQANTGWDDLPATWTGWTAWNSNPVTSFRYTHPVIDLDGPLTFNLNAVIVPASGDTTQTYLSEYRYRDDISGDTYTSWATLDSSTQEILTDRFQYRITVTNPETTGLETIALRLFADPIEEDIYNFAVPSGGTVTEHPFTVPVTKSFGQILNISVVVVGDVSRVWSVAITDISDPAAPECSMLTSTATASSPTVNIHVTGY